ncbi:putative OHCU decarboxylase [Serratia entomophila]|jgi:2-oxo-4-hydroxy-4-carboxy-5-ureidoimidazoline decarboxylase|uniref:2-oxo-4-hydroxy-4-carboxy-5-ureidoimidazoline decarboxylase n=1 Tax=Serratia entomophila TaxID=42906 RepID=A0ABY5CUH7_9GAMM|nr:2-oxo-4-hydroxy-4-carboxy-5-ureidoimidazoline decarboxylase [Serratia entomophila]UIW19154.1 2-oxo-4-hydroxy-4-carboxy-5-ureidoimidazoline decarboxylase [Serratia entomophila]USV01814.1 2-oxo-4-hydroxy-4-carboxy-5-ureidoimidazoline decarboxylase [Serratia entomophila]CAI0695855.1 putative OHCU decarboxylase [Serratia entomophila]CAI0765501.1 putative OHCU decarboxylase [Serratia entomophila]CAI0791314.1 putative OHCU decarboxylase [Serratia entomophila]
MELQRFNRLSAAEAERLLRPCVDIDSWIAALIAARPFSGVDAALAAARQAALRWRPDDVARALAAHPRIGERAQGQGAEAQFSRREQSAVDGKDAALQQALLAGNRRYEEKFERVFLIRAAGRDGQAILRELERRLHNDAPQEQRETAEQLREITLLRLKELLSDE